MAVNVLTRMLSDDTKFARGKTILRVNGAAALEYEILSVPRKTFIKDIFVDVVSAYDTDGTIIVGFKGNKESADANAFFTGVDANINAAGLYRMTIDSSALYKIGKYFDDGSGTITATISEGASSDGCTVRLFVDYCVIF